MREEEGTYVGRQYGAFVGTGGGRGSSGMESDGDIRALEGSASLKVKYPLDWIGLARASLVTPSIWVQRATIRGTSAGTWIRGL